MVKNLSLSLAWLKKGEVVTIEFRTCNFLLVAKNRQLRLSFVTPDVEVSSTIIPISRLFDRGTYLGRATAGHRLNEKRFRAGGVAQAETIVMLWQN